MFAGASQSDPLAPLRPAPPLERAEGALALEFRVDGGATRLARGFQQGSFRVRFPRSVDAEPEAVLLNTAGGLAGGDAFRVSADLAPGAAVRLTTQAAEKVYRSGARGAARLDVRLTLGERARLLWLPQETILFDGGGLERRIEATLAGDSELLACEAVVLGRTARGERVATGALADQWRVRRDGRLVFADALRLAGDIASAASRPATLAGAAAFATVLLVAPDAENRLGTVRAALDPATDAGASAWNGMLLARLVAEDGAKLRAALLAVLAALGTKAPRAWSI